MLDSGGSFWWIDDSVGDRSREENMSCCWSKRRGNFGARREEKKKKKPKRPLQRLQEMRSPSPDKIRGKIRIGFWNVAELKGKGLDFWEFIRQQDYVGMGETWIREEEGRDWMKNLPPEFDWHVQYAVREQSRGKGSGGILVGNRKGILMAEEVDVSRRGLVKWKGQGGGHKWTISTVYAKDGPEEFKEEIACPEQRLPEEQMIIGEDLMLGLIMKEGCTGKEK